MSFETLIEQDSVEVRGRLLTWFDESHRDLPWRHTSDPYAIWISEVMLQQTQVSRVVIYFERFLNEFPTLEALAAAPLDNVLKLWEGLGYYSRARNLHRAAQVIVQNLDGKFPQTAQELQNLPGFGSYTAAAVASIAFGESVATVDGNVWRVLTRLACFSGTRNHLQTRKQVLRLAQNLLDQHHPGNFNQAMMELGATLCRPRNPACTDCPVSEFCGAFRSGTPEQWPQSAPKTYKPVIKAACGILKTGDSFLVVQRPLEGLLGGLWEFPGARCHDQETLEAACLRGIQQKTGLHARVANPLTVVHHTFSHFRVELSAFICHIEEESIPSGRGTWVTLQELDQLALTRTMRKIIPFLTFSSQM